MCLRVLLALEHRHRDAAPSDLYLLMSVAPPPLSQVGAIRTQSPHMQHKMGPVTCMAWHPYNLYLGAAGNDSVASVYIVDNVPSASPVASGVSYAPTSISSLGPGTTIQSQPSSVSGM
jgi:hypothetical protein